MSEYSINYFDDRGVYRGNISNFSVLEYAGKENDVGVMTLTIPEWELSPRLDWRFEIRRRVGTGSFDLEFETQWFMRYWRREKKGTTSNLLVKAYTANDLLRRHIIAYFADTPRTSKIAHIDDMIKEFVRENLGGSVVDFDTSLPEVSRDLSRYLSEQPDIAKAPILDKSASWKNVLSVLQELVETSYSLGTYLCFDVVKTPLSEGLEFRTYVGQRGINRGSTSQAPLIVSVENGSLSEASLTYDYSQEVTHSYVGGRGQGIDRVVKVSSDLGRASRSVLNRVESFSDSRNTEGEDKISSEAYENLMSGRPKIIFEGTLSDTDKIVYGRDYRLGDILYAQYDEDNRMDCHLNTVHVTVKNGEDTVQAKLRGETYVK